MSVRRFDLVGPLGQRARLDSETGFLHASVRPTRTGVFVYRMPDGTISRELKHPEDVFDAASLESLKRLVLTRGHPRDAKGLPIDVTTENVKRLQVGQAGDDIRRVSFAGHDLPEVDATITDKATVESVTTKGRDQVSLGYRTEVVEESGEFNGEPYDRRHTNIRYNHLAVDIDAGRGGWTVAFQLDEADAVLDVPHNPTRQTRTDAMEKIIIDGTEVELEPGKIVIIKAALERRDAKIDALATAVKTKTDANEATQAKLDQATAEVTKLKSDADKSKTDAGAVDVGAQTRDLIDVVGRAALVGKLDEKATAALLDLKPAVVDGKPRSLVAEIRRKVVIDALGDEGKKLEGKSDAYFEARFDALYDAIKSGDSTTALARALAGPRKTDAADPRAAKGEDKDLQQRLDAVLNVDDPLKHADPKSFVSAFDIQPAATAAT